MINEEVKPKIKVSSLTDEERADLERRRKEDFSFLVTCQFKHNMSMYDLMRDRGLDDYENS